MGTLIHIMRALEPLEHQDSILSYIDQLISEDPTRRGFYLDFRSKYLMENEVDKLAVREEISGLNKSHNGFKVDLSSKELSSIHYAVYLTGSTEVDLSRNEIRHLESLAQFQNVRNINASSNKITSCEGLESLPLLNSLDLSDNLLETIEDLEPLKNCLDLQRLTLSRNPIVKTNALGLQVWLTDNLANVSCNF